MPTSRAMLINIQALPVDLADSSCFLASVGNFHLMDVGLENGLRKGAHPGLLGFRLGLAQVGGH